MPPAFLQVAIPVLYVYDEGTLPEAPPGFDMGLLPVISRALKEHANTSKVTVITGAPTPAEELPRSFTGLGLQYAHLQRASPEAGNLLVAEFVADHFDMDSVIEHLLRIRDERQRELAESVDAVTTKKTRDAGDASDDAAEEGGVDADAAMDDATAGAAATGGEEADDAAATDDARDEPPR